MDIVLNEKELAEDAINLGVMPVGSYQTLSCIARYYKSKGYNKTQIRRELEEFLLRVNPNYNLDKWEGIITNTLKTSAKYPLLEIEYVPVTWNELETISLIESKRLKRLAFTLLCIAKFYDITKTENHGWVNLPYNTIFLMANIKTSLKEECLLINKLCALGMIKMSHAMTNLSIKVEFINSTSDVALKITDFRNLGNQYMLYTGEAYIKCSSCGLVVKRKNTKQKYCVSCAKEQNKIKTIENRKLN